MENAHFDTTNIFLDLNSEVQSQLVVGGRSFALICY